METLKKHLSQNSYRWLITGSAGFIGVNLAKFLIKHGQNVMGVDNFITGHKSNIDYLEEISKKASGKFAFTEMDVTSFDCCMEVTKGIDIVLHQAALGSVPRSLKDPLDSHKNNVNGHLNIFESSTRRKVKKIIYASSSSVYGDHKSLPKTEPNLGQLMSPYAVTKRINEIYSEIYFKCYGVKSVGIRYFNVFGERQDENSIYSAVIPKWIKSMLLGHTVEIYGDGQTTRDFCFVDNAVYMNILVALSDNSEIYGKVFNCSCGQQTSLNQLYDLLKSKIEALSGKKIKIPRPIYKDFRSGDIKHSLADYSLAKKYLSYNPMVFLPEGIEQTLKWYYN